MKQKVKYYNNTIYDLELKQSNIVDAGLGVFLSKNSEIIPKDTFIRYYEGEWLTNDKLKSDYSYYINKHVYIDIDPFNKPYSCMINDAYNSSYENNVMSKPMIEPLESITRRNYKKFDVNKIIGLYTTKDICPGDELFFDYGEDYW